MWWHRALAVYHKAALRRQVQRRRLGAPTAQGKAPPQAAAPAVQGAPYNRLQAQQAPHCALPSHTGDPQLEWVAQERLGAPAPQVQVETLVQPARTWARRLHEGRQGAHCCRAGPKPPLAPQLAGAVGPAAATCGARALAATLPTKHPALSRMQKPAAPAAKKHKVDPAPGDGNILKFFDRQQQVRCVHCATAKPAAGAEPDYCPLLRISPLASHYAPAGGASPHSTQPWPRGDAWQAHVAARRPRSRRPQPRQWRRRRSSPGAAQAPGCVAGPATRR